MRDGNNEGRAAVVLNRQRAVKLAIPPLQAFAQRVREELGLRESLTICFVTDAEIARMNEAFRNKPGPTDVLSFPGRVPRGQPRKLGALSRSARVDGSRAEEYLGDIAISPAAARRNARAFGRTLPAELRILMLHGVLHLLGYDHETDHGKMNRLETKLRRRFGLA
jgi:probable rRNA maturation factor